MSDLLIVKQLQLLLVGVYPLVIMAQCDDCKICHNHYWHANGEMYKGWTPFLLNDPDLEYRDYEEHLRWHMDFMRDLGLSYLWQYDTDGQMEVIGRLYDLGML